MPHDIADSCGKHWRQAYPPATAHASQSSTKNIQAERMRNFVNFQTKRVVLAAVALTAIGSASLLSGCAATTAAIEKRNLDVQTKMSATIFLDPTSEANKTVFVQIRNTSDKADFDIAPDLTAATATKGYRVVTDPDLPDFDERSDKPTMASPPSIARAISPLAVTWKPCGIGIRRNVSKADGLTRTTVYPG
jgi:Enterobacterial TraT complement resistance protein